MARRPPVDQQAGTLHVSNVRSLKPFHIYLSIVSLLFQFVCNAEEKLSLRVENSNGERVKKERGNIEKSGRSANAMGVLIIAASEKLFNHHVSHIDLWPEHLFHPKPIIFVDQKTCRASSSRAVTSTNTILLARKE